jgi:uncharacterized protein YbjQ (UPF0145 family)
MADLLILMGLIALGYFAGSATERRHYRDIAKREEAFLHLPAVTFKSSPTLADAAESRLVTGCAVISVDYFKRILAGLRALVGGRVKSYESLIDRARREAVLRMKEADPTADIIVNTRIETASISKGPTNRQSVGTIEALAYGTAIHVKKQGT